MGQGLVDIPLAADRISEAEKQRAAFADAGISFSHCISSDLSRAKDTAHILAPSLEVFTDAGLRDCSFGRWEGVHADAIHSGDNALIFDRLSALSHEERIRTAYFDGLECPLEMARRAVATVSTAAARWPGATILAVTHSTIMESLMAVVDGKRFEGIAMRRLAWICMEVGLGPNGTAMSPKMLETDGIQFFEHGHAHK